MDRCKQESLLATHLWCNDVAMESADAFLLNIDLFDADLKHIVELVNDTTETEDRYYSMLNLKIQEHFPFQWTRISEQTPMIFRMAKHMHDEMVRQMKIAELKNG